MEKKSLSALKAAYPEPDRAQIREALDRALRQDHSKVVVLDDDPTGIQTVHDVNVYTDWSFESVLAGFEEPGRMFYLLTNSRSFSAQKTAAVHAEIAHSVAEAARRTHKGFVLVSRGDSTLRGHWPLETQTLADVFAAEGEPADGEIIAPFFCEGGRYTAGNVHYVADGDTLVPAGETEFARDATFGYGSSDLCGWIEEKSHGRVHSSEVCAVGLDELRARDVQGIEKRLLEVHDFGKVIVNALDECDIQVFCTALLGALARGRRFVLRTAAAVPKVLGGVSDRPLLTRAELLNGDPGTAGGLILVGSHVKKTSDQLAELQRCSFMDFIEFNQHLVLQPELLEAEIERVAAACGERIAAGRTVACYTRREMLKLDTDDPEEQLRVSVLISHAVTQIVQRLAVRPSFVIAKGGITSSDIGVEGLGVRRALVLGQILPGIPVWRTGPESRFPGMAYVIFPGNVGGKTALADAVRLLTAQDGRN